VPRSGDVTRQVVVEAGWSLEAYTYVQGYPIDIEFSSARSDGSHVEVHERKTLQNSNTQVSAHHRDTYRPSETRVYTFKWRNTARLQARYVAFALLLRDPSGQLVQRMTNGTAVPAAEETKA
jgi:hypothetical protein